MKTLLPYFFVYDAQFFSPKIYFKWNFTRCMWYLTYLEENMIFLDIKYLQFNTIFTGLCVYMTNSHWMKSLGSNFVLKHEAILSGYCVSLIINIVFLINKICSKYIYIFLIQHLPLKWGIKKQGVHITWRHSIHEKILYY